MLLSAALLATAWQVAAAPLPRRFEADLLTVVRFKSGGGRIVERVNGRRHEVYAFEHDVRMALAPDGRHLAVADLDPAHRDSVVVLTPAGQRTDVLALAARTQPSLRQVPVLTVDELHWNSATVLVAQWHATPGSAPQTFSVTLPR